MTYKLPEGWKEVKLGEAILVNPSETLDRNGMYKKVAMVDVIEHTKRIANYKLDKYNGGVKFRNGDTVFARITPSLENGKIAYVDILEEDEVGFGSTEFLVLREKDNITLSDYVYYLAKSPLIVDTAIKSMVGSSGRQRVQNDVFKNINIKLPPLKEQKAIAHTLSALDDKIELNNKINKNLEAQAQAIFKSWFIDFEPFKNGEFVESELGMIPKGWEVAKLSNFMPIITGKKNANVAKDDGQYKFFTCSQAVSLTDSYSFEGKAILVAGNGDFNVKFYNGKFEAYQRTYVLIPNNSALAAFIYYAVKHNLNEIILNARGSVISYLTKGDLEDSKVAIPNNLEHNKIVKLLDKINAIILSNNDQNQKLSQLRDTLLPKLMSGEIRIPLDEQLGGAL